MPTPRNGVLRHGTRNAYERHKCRCEECEAQNRERHAKWVEKNRERSRELSRESYARHRDEHRARKKEAYSYLKAMARNAALAAVQRGDLVRGPCEQEGSDCVGEIQAHHDDYSRPLDVRWLCKSHHRRHHLAEQRKPD